MGKQILGGGCWRKQDLSLRVTLMVLFFNILRTEEYEADEGEA